MKWRCKLKCFCIVFIIMTELPSVTLVKEHTTGDYYDYVGRVEVKPSSHVEGASYVVILDRKTGEQICQICGKDKKLFHGYNGKVVSFRGKDEGNGIVIPHVK